MKASHWLFLSGLTAFALISCDKIEEGIGKLANGGAAKGEVEIPVEPEEKRGSIQASGRLPVLTKFKTLSTGEMDRFIGYDDRIAVVEFYADW